MDQQEPPSELRSAHNLLRAEQWQREVSLMRTRLKQWGQPGKEIHPQQKCLFYNGRIPLEITLMIFEYALSPNKNRRFVVPNGPPTAKGHDFRVRFDHEKDTKVQKDNGHDGVKSQAGSGRAEPAHTSLQPQTTALGLQNNSYSPKQFRSMIPQPTREWMGYDWFRPETGDLIKFPGWSLLLTCRRIYLDAIQRHARNREVVLFEGRKPTNGLGLKEFLSLVREKSEGPYFDGIYPFSMRLYAQMYLLVSWVSFSSSCFPNLLPFSWLISISLSIFALLRFCQREVIQPGSGMRRACRPSR